MTHLHVDVWWRWWRIGLNELVRWVEIKDTFLSDGGKEQRLMIIKIQHFNRKPKTFSPPRPAPPSPSSCTPPSLSSFSIFLSQMLSFITRSVTQSTSFHLSVFSMSVRASVFFGLCVMDNCNLMVLYLKNWEKERTNIEIWKPSLPSQTLPHPTWKKWNMISFYDGWCMNVTSAKGLQMTDDQKGLFAASAESV